MDLDESEDAAMVRQACSLNLLHDFLQEPLVSIQHTWSERRHFFRGTRIFFAIQMILKKYPELKGPAQITFPALRRLCP
jgi:hypothetical protein